MRIRKRQVPLPLSSLSSISFSDPNSPMVQLHQRNDPHQNLSLRADTSYFRPSDHRNQPIGSRTDGLDYSDADAVKKDKDCLVLLQEKEDYKRREDDEEGGEKMNKSNDTRKNHILGAEIAAAGILSQLSSSHQVAGRWNEGEKAFPLKKRRGSLDRGGEDEEEEEKEKKMKTKIKTKMNKKFAEKNNNDDEEEKGSTAAAAENNSKTSSKKRARGGAIMEGSRCSRVNGRGWRCCQQTLVGYSLCEHHLGKGRLRSMNSVRIRSLGSSVSGKNEKSKQPLMSTLEESKSKGDHEDGRKEEYEKKPLMINAKKKLKLGMVKARSISSLLEEKDSEMIITSDNL